jgi:hypothetical protein
MHELVGRVHAFGVMRTAAMTDELTDTHKVPYLQIVSFVKELLIRTLLFTI